MATVTNRTNWLRAPEPEWLLDALFAVVVVIHGPVDVGLTWWAWVHETNPVVQWLGLSTWIVVKGVVLLAALFVWYDATKDSPEPYTNIAAAFLGIWIGLGLALIIPNLLVLAGVAG